MKKYKTTFKNLSLENLDYIAIKIAKQLKPKDVITLKSDLGGGKTSFAKILLKKLNVSEDVTSPTFNIVHLYDTIIGKAWHYDLYRVRDFNELFELGVEEGFDIGLSIIEWPEIAKSILPETTIEIEIEFTLNPNTRDVIIISYKNLGL